MSEERPEASSGAEQDSVSTLTDAPEVMVSYAWAYKKPLVLRIAADLRAAGISVWLDETDLQDRYVVGMLRAVKKSRCVLVMASPSYIASKSCETEANAVYRFKLEDSIVVNLAGDGFDPEDVDHVLGAIALSRLWVDFRRADASEAEYTAALDRLLLRLGALGIGPKAATRPTPVTTPTAAAEAPAASSTRGGSGGSGGSGSGAAAMPSKNAVAAAAPAAAAPAAAAAVPLPPRVATAEEDEDRSVSGILSRLRAASIALASGSTEARDVYRAGRLSRSLAVMMADKAAVAQEALAAGAVPCFARVLRDCAALREVLEPTCHALRVIATAAPAAKKAIAQLPADQDVFPAVVRALATHGVAEAPATRDAIAPAAVEAAELAKEACNVLANACADTVENKLKCADAGAVAELLRLVRSHAGPTGDTGVLESALTALRTLTNGCPRNRDAALAGSLFPVLNDVSHTHEATESVLHQAIMCMNRAAPDAAADRATVFLAVTNAARGAASTALDICLKVVRDASRKPATVATALESLYSALNDCADTAPQRVTARQKQAHLAALSAVKTHKNSTEVARFAARVLFACCANTPDVKAAVVSAGGVETMMAALKAVSGNAEVSHIVLSSLRVLVGKCPTGRTALLVSGLLPYAVTLATTHLAKSQEVAREVSLVAYWCALDHPEGATAAKTAGVLTLMQKLLAMPAIAGDMVIDAADAVKVICTSTENRGAAHSAGLMAALIPALRRLKGDKKVVISVCSALAAMTKGHGPSKAKFAELDGFALADELLGAAAIESATAAAILDAAATAADGGQDEAKATARAGVLLRAQAMLTAFPASALVTQHAAHLMFGTAANHNETKQKLLDTGAAAALLTSLQTPAVAASNEACQLGLQAVRTIANYDGPARTKLQAAGALGVAVATLRTHSADAETCKEALTTLGNVCTDNLPGKEAAAAAHALEGVTPLLRAFPRHVALWDAAAEAVRVLANACAGNKAAARTSGLLGVLAQALRPAPDRTESHIKTLCGAVERACTGDASCKQAVVEATAAEGGQALAGFTATLRQYVSNTNVAAAMGETLWALCDDHPAARTAARAAGAPQAALAALRECRGSASAVTGLAKALWAMSANATETKALLTSEGAAAQLVAAARSSIADGTAACWCLTTLRVLANGHGPAKDANILAGALGVAVAVMNAFPARSDVLKDAAQVFNNSCDVKQEHRISAGGTGFFAACAAGLRNASNDAGVCQHIANAVKTLCADVDDNRQLAAAAGLHALMTAAMTTHAPTTDAGKALAAAVAVVPAIATRAPVVRPMTAPAAPPSPASATAAAAAAAAASPTAAKSPVAAAGGSSGDGGEGSGKECAVCFELPPSVALNCGHCFCEKCAPMLTRCAICRTVVTMRIKLFL